MKKTPPKARSVGRPSEGKKPYLVTLTQVNAEKAKKREKNFSGLMDSLLTDWLKR